MQPFCLSNYLHPSHPTPTDIHAFPATSWAPKSISSQLSIAPSAVPDKCGSLSIWTQIKCASCLKSHNAVNLTYGREKVAFVRGGVEAIAWGLFRLHQLILLHGSWNFRDDFPGISGVCVFVFKMWVGRKINVFGLQMVHKGILIYSVLWRITAQSNISNGAGCVQVNC